MVFSLPYQGERGEAPLSTSPSKERGIKGGEVDWK